MRVVSLSTFLHHRQLTWKRELSYCLHFNITDNKHGSESSHIVYISTSQTVNMEVRVVLLSKFLYHRHLTWKRELPYCLHFNITDNKHGSESSHIVCISTSQTVNMEVRVVLLSTFLHHRQLTWKRELSYCLHFYITDNKHGSEKSHIVYISTSQTVNMEESCQIACTSKSQTVNVEERVAALSTFLHH